ncbi:hypothetical protein [Ramlibacter alkalitolerans]|uniref:Uncharacterized protein n=1 Tax=Ramlibacter alkalitolerans TaxID=2039631 RepID=A0ABS1JUU5_9BURK|nr:hypothetical protein [Ramlibacter alkalitolerans]MBL0427977.1 hypothetical protein [Ramlibacter alkalitolerans]
MDNKVRHVTSRRRTDPRAAGCGEESRTVVRPLRALFQHLNQPEPSPYCPQRIADHAATSMRVITLGLAAIGDLLAQSAVQVEERRIPTESVESLGRLMAELGDLAALCHQLCTEPFGPTLGITIQEERER